MIQSIPVRETRKRLADLINEVDIARKEFIITRFGKPKAMLVPVTAIRKRKSSALTASFGLWKDRADIKDTNQWVAKLRAKMSIR